MEEDCIGSHGPQWAVMLDEKEKENEEEEDDKEEEEKEEKEEMLLCSHGIL